MTKEKIYKKALQYIKSGMLYHEAATEIGVLRHYISNHFPDLISLSRINSDKRKMAKHAEIIEYFVNNPEKTQDDIKHHFNASRRTIQKSINLYFEKPTKNLTLKSKV